MELESSVLCLEEPVTNPYPEPGGSSPTPTHPISLRSIVILSSHLQLDLQNRRFLSRFPYICIIKK
jgi:hypothetical protein